MLNKVTSTLHRAATLARIAGAARKVSAASGTERVAARAFLASLLGDARGIPMKVGQFLADCTEGDAFAPLTQSVEPIDIDQIRIEIEIALGTGFQDAFASIESTGIAASLGQVHRARLTSGEAVAVKVRYPDIVSAVEAELRLARLLPGLGPVRTWGFDLESYKRVLIEDLRAELDYRGEALRQQSFRARMNVSGLVVPRVHPDWSAENLLVQDWEEGLPLESILDWQESDRRQVGLILMSTLFQSLFHHGEIHGDPHSGNYRYRLGGAGKPEVILLDFGCTVPVSRESRLALLKLILGAVDKDDTDPAVCFRAMGFDAEKLKPIAHLLPALSGILLEPFTSPGTFQLQSWDLRRRVDHLLGDLKWWFRSAGPANLLLLLRAFRGLMMQLDTLRVSLPWLPVLLRVIGPELAREARGLVLTSLEGKGAQFGGFKALAQFLRVRVTENGKPVVALTYPANQAIFLRDLIPEESIERIQAAGIDLAAIQSRVCANGLRPEELFQYEEGGRNFRVWLE